MMQPIWLIMTIVMVMALTTNIMLLMIQRKSFKWYSQHTKDNNIHKNKRELFCLYGVYIFSAICSIQCFMCHISNILAEWYCIYGMSICVIIYALTKTLLYGFFLERAKATQSARTNIFKLPAIFTKYILPIYISCYFIMYLILCPLKFRGLLVISSNKIINNKNSIPTSCIFGEYESWIFFFSVGVDIFNAIFFLWLFAYPLCKMIKTQTTPQKGTNDLIKIIKHNIIFSSICSISSIPFLFVMGFANNSNLNYYLWLMGDIDSVINATCTFLMVTANRKYIYYIYTKHFKTKKSANNHNTKSDGDNKSTDDCDQKPDDKITKKKDDNQHHIDLDKKRKQVGSVTDGNTNIGNTQTPTIKNTENRMKITVMAMASSADSTTNEVETTSHATTQETVITLPKLNKSITPFGISNTGDTITNKCR